MTSGMMRDMFKKVMDFGASVNEKDFIRLFGNGRGKELWKYFSRNSRRCVVDFYWAYLHNNLEKKIFLHYINKRY